MPWLEKDLENNNVKPVAPETMRSFTSIFHDPGQPQIELVYLDEHRVQITVPDIVIDTGPGSSL